LKNWKMLEIIIMSKRSITDVLVSNFVRDKCLKSDIIYLTVN